MVTDIVKTELIALRDKYGDPRRTKIVDATGEFVVEDLIADEPMVITISHNGYIKRLPIGTYRRQRPRRPRRRRLQRPRGRLRRADLRRLDAQLSLVLLESRPLLLGQGARAAAGRPHGARQGDRQPAVAVARRSASPAPVPVRDFTEEGYLVMATRKGVIKRCNLADFSNPRRGGIIAIGLHDGDSLVGVALTPRHERDRARQARRQGGALQGNRRALDGPRRGGGARRRARRR
jgi:DNA gyrase subunit A